MNLVTDFSYDDRGLLICQTEINASGVNKSTAYQWDSLGRRIATVCDPNGLKLTTTYQYDANDNLVCETDANQHSTHYVYDAFNRCRYQINARGVVTEHLYDLNGNEIETVSYANSITPLLHYDEASLKSALKEDSGRDHYTFRLYNSLGQVTSVYDGAGYATTYDYDKNGNVIHIIKYATATPLDILKKGNRPRPSKAGARDQYFAYDGLNQLRFTSNDNGYFTESQYDKSGQLIRSTKYAEPIYLNSDYSLDNILSNLKSDPLSDQTIHYTYDKAGRVAIELSAGGIAKSYQYDSLGHVIASTLYATPVSLASLTSFDELHLIKSANDRTNHFVYDVAGREVYRISSDGRVFERRYDDVGNVIAELTHAVPLHLSLYNEESINKALYAQRQQAQITGYDYDAAGRLLTEINAQKLTTRYTYDAQGNVLNKMEANQSVWTYQYDEVNQLIETRTPSIKITTASGVIQRSIVTRHRYDSFGNLIEVVRDAEGLKQTQLYEFDNNNHKIKTIYPGVNVNCSTTSASNQRQEISKTLTEEIKYNAWGDVIASSDKAGNWKHFTYDNQGLLVYSLDTQDGVTFYRYDSFDRVIQKTLYANPLQRDEHFNYTIDAITKALCNSKYDRNEFYSYNLDNQVVEIRRDPVLMYNPRTGHYDTSLTPTTKNAYNAFGEVIKSSVKINELDWADTYTYYDHEGRQTAVIDAEGYLTTYQYNAFGNVESMTEYARAVNEWNTERYSSGQSSSKDRTVTYSYDALGQLTSKTLKQVSYERLKPGTNEYEKRTSDLITTYSYDALGHLTSTTDAKGNTAYCYYDELGQLIARVSPQTSDGRATTTYSYDALGHLLETRQWAQGALEADEFHFLLKGASAQDILTKQIYDVQGQLIAEIDGLNRQVNYSYDTNGNLARSWRTLSQADGSLLIQDKRYTYDSEHHLLETATFKNTGKLHTEGARYNIFGELIAKGADGRYTTHVDYDQSGRVWRSNTEGYYQIFVYDLMGQVTQIVTSTNSFRDNHQRHGVDLSDAFFEGAINYNQDVWYYDLQRQDNIYDKSGHLLSQKKEFSVEATQQKEELHLESVKQSQTVDRWGNMLTYTNARGLITYYEYNAFNFVIKQELPEVYIVDEHGVGRLLKPVNYYAYDELGQSIAMIDANGHGVSKEYDAMGRVILERDGKGNKRTKHYNLLDQLTSAVNESGGVTSYTYDKTNRLIAINTPKTYQRYEYNEAGELIKQINGKGEASSYWYDTLGNQVKRSDASGHETQYEYDAFGHKTKELDAEGRSQSWVYNDAGRVVQHVDLGGHTTSYEYNTNGLLIEERSTAGKQIKYHYRGDGSLIQYADEGLNETVNYTYDAEGQMLSKESARGSTSKDGWVRETDYYQYDTLGRLLQVRRRNPEDKGTNMPDKDHALLSIDYDYDAVGNIRHTHVSANYTGYETVQSDDYYLYDENNRMIVNKGQLVNGQIMMTNAQGSTSSYDAAGNILTSSKYEHGAIQNYHYVYNNENQLELIQQNGINLQSRFYDEAGQVIEEHSFDGSGHLAQKNIMSYDKGLLKAQSTYNSSGAEISKTTFEHDKVGNLTELKLRTNSRVGAVGHVLIHEYSYALWDNYQQSLDKATQISDDGRVTTGRSTRAYDKNGQLQETIDAQGITSTYYLNSGVEGIKGRRDKDGQISYLSVAGKTIGDLRLDNVGKQHLTVYGGFTPSGTQQKAEPSAQFMWQQGGVIQTTTSFLDRTAQDNANVAAPEAPQDNLGAYTLQAGDTLERVALQVYGDSSLWYLLADANGINDKNAQVGSSGQLHLGQRLNIPPVATGQHQTHATHKVLNPNERLGIISATTSSLPPTPPPLPKKHNGFFSKLVVGIIAVVATVMTAGIVGALAGATIEGGGGLFALGSAILGGTAATTGVTLATGFAAGFVGSIASQGVAKALGMQENVNFKGALISGLATAATSGLLHGLNQSASYSGAMKTLDELPMSKNFRISSAAQLMEQNALSQGINLTLQKHQHFDWEQLAAAGVIAGFMGGAMGRKLDETLKTVDHNTGILRSEVRSVVTAGVNAAVKGSHFSALDVLGDHLGSAIGESLVDTQLSNEQPRLMEDNFYLKGTALEILDPGADDELAYQNYQAQQLSVDGGYESSSEQSASSIDSLQDLFLNSESYLSDNNTIDKSSFESNIYWNSQDHSIKRFIDDSHVDMKTLEFYLPSSISTILNFSSKKIWEIRAFQGTPIPGQKAGKVNAIERLVGFNRSEWNRLKEFEISNNLDGLQHHVLNVHKKYPNVSVELINAVIVHESQGTWNAISTTGALGVMQLTADNYYTGRNANFNPFNVAKSINYGAGMLSDYLGKFGTTKEGVRKALASYNQGYGHVSRIIKQHGSDWINHIHEEGRSYIKDIESIRNNKKKIPGYFGEQR